MTPGAVLRGAGGDLAPGTLCGQNSGIWPLSLGADVPFFLDPTPGVWSVGIGEEIQFLSETFPSPSCVLSGQPRKGPVHRRASFGPGMQRDPSLTPATPGSTLRALLRIP